MVTLLKLIAVYPKIYILKKTVVNYNVKLLSNAVTDVPKSVLSAMAKYFMDTVKANAADKMFATINVKTFAAATVHHVLLSAP